MNKKEFFSRKGYVKIGRDLRTSAPEAVMEMQAHMLIMDAIYNFVEDTVTLRGYSEEFEPIGGGIEVPKYEAIFKNNHFVKFEKKGGKLCD